MRKQMLAKYQAAWNAEDVAAAAVAAAAAQARSSTTKHAPKTLGQASGGDTDLGHFHYASAGTPRKKLVKVRC